MQKGNLNGIDEHKKLKILEEIAKEKGKNKSKNLILNQLDIITSEMAEMSLQIYNQESLLKSKDRQLNLSLHNRLIDLLGNGIPDSIMDPNSSDFKELKDMDKNKLLLNLAKANKSLSEMKKANGQLRERITHQTELITQLESQKGRINHKSYQMMEEDVNDSWEVIEKIADYVAKENAILHSTNEELMSELNAYKTFFSSQHDTLERTSSCSYQMLLSLGKHNEIMELQLERYKIKTNYAENNKKIKKEIISKEIDFMNDTSLFSEDIESQDGRARRTKNRLMKETTSLSLSVHDQIVEDENSNDLVQKNELLASKIKYLTSKNKHLREVIDKLLREKINIKDDIYQLKEDITRMNVKIFLGPEVLEKLGHPQETSSSFAASKVAESQATKIKHNMIKDDAKVANQVLELLAKNRELEENLEISNAESEDLQNRLKELELELKTLKASRSGLTDKKSLPSKRNLEKDNKLLLKIKARDVELAILRKERDDIQDYMNLIKQFQTEVKAMILGVPDEYSDINGRSTYQNKYSEYIERMMIDISKFYEKFRETYNMALKSKYYLKLAEIQNNRQKSIIEKLEADLMENRKDEMIILDRIINGNKSNDCCDNCSKNEKSKPQKTSYKSTSQSASIPKVLEDSKQNIKNTSKKISLETQASALQRRVHKLRAENDMLKSNLHNSQQNYIALSEQLIALQLLNEASTSTNMIQIPNFKDSDSAWTEGFSHSGYLPFKSLDYSKSNRFVLPETLRSSSKMYPQNLVFNNQKLLTSLLKIWQKAKAQISQCTLKCCTQDLIRLLVTSNPSLKTSKITTESEQKLLQKVDELEKSNKSLRQNLLDMVVGS